MKELETLATNPLGVLESDCNWYNEHVNQDAMIYHYLSVHKCTSGYFQLCYDGEEVWWGTALEVNAAIKTLIRMWEVSNREE